MANVRPSFQFYPGDWLKDPALRSVSLASRGLWIDMLCLMHESDRRGYLYLSGKPVTAEQLARMTGCSTDDASRQLQELSSSGVCSCTEHGVYYNRRMVRDEQKRHLCSEAGKRGGNPRLKATFKGVSKGRNKGPPTPSSSSSPSGEENASAFSPPPSGGDSAPSQRKPNPVWDAICERWGFRPTTTRDQRRIGRLTADLRAKLTAEGIAPEQAASEIAARAERHSQSWDVPVTAESLLKHWDELGSRWKPRAGKSDRAAAYRSDQTDWEAVQQRKAIRA